MTADTFQFKRGSTASVNAYLPAIGEPVYDSTLKRFRIGDGVTLGGVDPTLTYANLSALAGLTGAADTLAYFTGVGTMAGTPLTAVARALLDDTTVTAQRATLGLVKTTSAIDTTAGSVLQVGDFGNGSLVFVPTWPNTSLDDCTGVGSGMYRAVGGTTGLPAGYSSSSIVKYVVRDNTIPRMSQVITEVVGAPVVRQCVRTCSGGTLAAPTWSAFNDVVFGGANSSITSLSGLTTALSVAQGGTGGNTQATARTGLGLVIGTDVQAFDADLSALATNSTNGLWARTGAGTGSARTITGTANEITVTNGDGVAGAPTLSVPTSLNYAGKTFTNAGIMTTVDINGGTVDGAVIGGASAAAGTFTTISGTTITASTSINLTGGQISFPATQVPSAGANVLDDYEEGTFTPTITFGTPGDLNVVYSVQTGNYTKVGRQVSWWANITTTTFTHTTASGNLTIAGLPFTAVSNPPAILSRWTGVTSAITTPQLNAIHSGTTIIFEMMNIAAGTNSAITTANAPTAVQKNFIIGGVYNV